MAAWLPRNVEHRARQIDVLHQIQQLQYSFNRDDCPHYPIRLKEDNFWIPLFELPFVHIRLCFLSFFIFVTARGDLPGEEGGARLGAISDYA